MTPRSRDIPLEIGVADPRAAYGGTTGVLQALDRETTKLYNEIEVLRERLAREERWLGVSDTRQTRERLPHEPDYIARTIETVLIRKDVGPLGPAVIGAAVVAA